MKKQIFTSAIIFMAAVGASVGQQNYISSSSDLAIADSDTSKAKSAPKAIKAPPIATVPDTASVNFEEPTLTPATATPKNTKKQHSTKKKSK